MSGLVYYIQINIQKCFEKKHFQKHFAPLYLQFEASIDDIYIQKFPDTVIICFCGMVHWGKAFSLIFNLDQCQRSSLSWISDTPRAGHELAQNLSSEIVIKPARQLIGNLHWGYSLIHGVYRSIANAMNVVTWLLWKSLLEMSFIIYGGVLKKQVVALSIYIYISIYLHLYLYIYICIYTYIYYIYSYTLYIYIFQWIDKSEWIKFLSKKKCSSNSKSIKKTFWNYFRMEF